MNSLSAISGYLRSSPVAIKPNGVNRDTILDEIVKVLEPLPKIHNYLSEHYLQELALIIRRPELKPGGVFIVGDDYERVEDCKLEKLERNLCEIALPVPFAIELTNFIPNQSGVYIERKFFTAKPIPSKFPNSCFNNYWGITNNFTEKLELSENLISDINPYWLEFLRLEFRQFFQREHNAHIFEEFVMYVGSTETDLRNLLAARNMKNKEGDLKRAEALGIPEEVAYEFCSLTIPEQIEAARAVREATDQGIIPRYILDGIWWWTTPNCINRTDEIKIAKEAFDFYKELEEVASPELLNFLPKD